MPHKPGKGHHRREAALERKATQRHDFIGEADAERAEAKFREHEKLTSERNADTVKEMASELEELAGVKQDGSMGPEIPFRIPRSVDEGRRMIREAPEKLREKARERLEKLPEPAQKAIGFAETVAGFALIPVRLGWGLARELFQVPLEMLRVLRQREA